MGIIKGRMEAKLLGAKGLKNTDFLVNRIDPYVLLQFGNREMKSTIAKGQGRNPKWNEKFEFKVEHLVAKDEQPKLVVTVMDHDTFTADDYLGQATIYVKEVIELGAEKGKAELHPQTYRLVSYNQTYHGEIQIGITFTAKEENEEEEYGGWKESGY